MSLHVISESYGDSSDHESSSSDDDDISIGKHRSARHSAARHAHDSGKVPLFFPTPLLFKLYPCNVDTYCYHGVTTFFQLCPLHED